MSAAGHRAELLARRRAVLAARRAQPTTAGEHDDLPLTAVQEAIWVAHRLDPGERTHQRPVAMRLRGPLDREALDRALTAVVARHLPLRAGFPLVDGEPRMIVQPPAPVAVTGYPLPDGAGDPWTAALEVATAAAMRPFDVEHDTLLRPILVPVAPDDQLLVLASHHLVMDGWSDDVLRADLVAAYDAALGAVPPLGSLAFTWADWVTWERDHPTPAALAGPLREWAARLAGLPPPPTIAPAAPGDHGHVVTRALPSGLLARLRDVAASRDATVFMALLAGYAQAWGELTGRSDVVVGVPVSGRRHPGAEALIGCFINVVPVRLDVEERLDPERLLDRARVAVLDAMSRQDVPLAAIVRAVGGGGPEAMARVVPTVFQLRNFPRQAVRVAADGLRVEAVDLVPPTGHLFEARVVSEGDEAEVVAARHERLLSPAAADDLLTRFTDALTTLAGRSRPARPAPAEAPDPASSRFPLAPAQERLWVLGRLWPEDTGYQLVVAHRLEGPLDRAALQRALDALHRRHEALRTRVLDDDGVPVQVVDPAGPAPVDNHDLGDLPPAERVPAARDLLSRLGAARIDLERGPAARWVLIRVGPDDHVLALVTHHVLVDGWSLAVLEEELGVCYAAELEHRPAALPALPLRPVELAVQLAEARSGGRYHEDLRFWVDELGDLPAPLALPADRPRPARRSGAGDRAVHDLGPLAAPVRRLVAETSASPFMVLAALSVAWLHRWTGQDDLVIGIPHADRDEPDHHRLVTMLVNTVPLRIRIPPGASLRTLVDTVKTAALAAYRHARVPFDEIVRVINPPRDPSRNPLFDVLVQQSHVFDDALALPGVRVSPVRVSLQRSALDLSIQPGLAGDRLEAELIWSTDLFDRPTVDAAARAWSVLAAAALARPDRPLADLPFPSEAPRMTPASPPPTLAAVAAAVAASDALAVTAATEAPDASIVPVVLRAGGAVEVAGHRFDTGVLASQAGALASALAGAGVRPGDRVAVVVGRTPWLVPALLGVLGAGAAFVPLAPDLPVARIRAVLDAARPSAVVTDGSVPLPDRWPVVHVDDVHPDPLAAWMPVPRQAGDPAYVIFTSGSTGAPKGVVVPHGALGAFCRAAVAAYGLGSGDRVLQFHSVSFDAAVEEIFATLTAGGTVVLRDDQALGSPARLLGWCGQHRITVLDLPTAFWQELAHAVVGGEATLPDALRMVITGGQAPRPAVVRDWHRAAGTKVRLWNSYGPTETTVAVTIADLSADPGDGRSPVAIGLPLPGVVAEVRGPDGSPVPDGTEGELWVAGAQVASGYLDDAELTAARFVHADGRRWYRTGDRVVRRTDGMLVHLGRLDQQVKIRGFRVEPAETEAVLGAHPAVRDLAVMAEGDEPELVAHVELRSGALATPDELRRLVAEHLPAAFVPARVEIHADLPRTAGGKVDRAALRAANGTRTTPTGEAVSTPGSGSPVPPDAVAAAVLAAWRELLGAPEAGPDDDFFALGGTSLMGVRLLARLERELGVSVPLVSLFEQPRLGDFLRLVAGQHGAEVPTARAALSSLATGETSPAEVPTAELPQLRPTAGPVPLGLDRGPLSAAQRRMWAIEQLLPGRAADHVQWALRLTGPLDRDALGRAVDAVITRHAGLRTRFVALDDGSPVQVIDPPGPLPVGFVDLAGLPEAERPAALATTLADDDATPFDLAHEWPVRVTVIRLARRVHVLAVCHHHITIDEASVAVVRQDLAEAYTAFAAGGTWTVDGGPALTPLDVAVWERAEALHLAGTEAWWAARFATLPEPLTLPLPPAPGPLAPGHHPAPTLDPQRTADLLAAGRRAGATPFATTLAAVVAWIHRLTGATDVVVAIPVTERRHAAVQQVVGFFVNTVPVRVPVRADDTFTTLLERVRTELAAAMDHVAVPFERIAELAGARVPERPGALPLAHLVWSLVDGRGAIPTFGGLTTVVEPLPAGTPKFELHLHGRLSDGGLQLGLHHTGTVTPGDGDRLAATVTEVFAALAARPRATLAEIPLGPVSAAETVPPPAERPRPTVADLLAEAAATWPDAPAVRDDHRTLTYRELLAAADPLAEQLRAAGAGAGRVIALRMPRSLELVVAMVAVVRAGGAYLPIDPTDPPEREARLVHLAGAVAMVDTDGTVRVIHQPDTPARLTVTEHDPVYVLFTSGSTGTPKAVAVPHRAVAHLVVEGDEVRLGPGVVIGHAAHPAFDATTFEVWGALCTGGTVQVLDPGTVLTPGALGDALHRHRVDVLFLTTALANLVARTDPGAVAGLDTLLFGGEAADVEAVRLLLGRGPRRLVHVYGPTETTTFATWFEVDHVPTDARSVPIGGPIGATRLSVRDTHGRPVPDGLVGELWIGGPGLALGYLGDEGRTAERFVTDPAVPGERWYRTGDLVVRDPSGELVFIGRVDAQVKVRGFRVEPVEVEQRLLDHPGVREAAVALDPVGARLVAAVVPAPGAAVTAEDVLATARVQLPVHQVPAVLAVVDHLPLTTSGKLDRAAVVRLVTGGAQPAAAAPPAPATTSGPVPTPAPPASALAPPIGVSGTPLDLDGLVQLWRRLLGTDAIDADTDFFDAGGHSLLAAELLAGVHRRTGLTLSLRTLLEARTPRALLAHLASASGTGDARPTGTPRAADAPWTPTPAEPVIDHPVWFRQDGDRVPLVFCPSGGGELLVYDPVARLLPAGHPVLGLPFRGDRRLGQRVRSIVEQAADHEADLRRALPTGPYVLLGYSSGGTLAIELAHRLRARGEQVPLVVLFDAGYLADLPTGLGHVRATFARAGASGVVQEARWALHLKREAVRVAALERRRPGTAATLAPVSVHDLRVRDTSLALRRHIPRPYPGPVLYVHAIDQPEHRAVRRWAAACTGPFEVAEVPGGHTGPGSLLDPANAPTTAAAVTAALTRLGLTGR